MTAVELKESVARAIYDILEGDVNNADAMRQSRQWALSLDLAHKAILYTTEAAAMMLEDKNTPPHLALQEYASMIRNLSRSM